MRKLSQSILIAWFILFSHVVFSEAFSLEQITRLALENNRDLKAARYNVARAIGRLRQAGLWPNPSITGSSFDDHLISNEGEYTRTVGLAQAFPISGRIGKQKQVARLDVLAAVAEIREAERQLTATTANAFYAAILTHLRIKQLNFLLTLNHQLVKVSENRYRAAEVSELDNNTAQIEHQRIHQEKQVLESIKISQYAKLNQLMGRPINQSLILDHQLPAIHLPLLTQLQALARKNRPDRRALCLAMRRAKEDISLAQREKYADWRLGLGFQQDRIAVDGQPRQTPDRLLGFNIEIPVPVLNGNQGRIQEALATNQQTAQMLQALDLVIDTEVASDYAQLRTLTNALKSNQTQILKLGLRNVQLAREAYSNGQLSMINLLLVQRQQNDLQTSYLNILEKYLQTYVALCTAIGPGKTVGLCSYSQISRR